MEATTTTIVVIAVLRKTERVNPEPVALPDMKPPPLPDLEAEPIQPSPLAGLLLPRPAQISD